MNRYNISHDLRIPVEDQRFRARAAKVNYKVPVYGYEYVDVQEQGCDPCCGCEIDIHDEINLNGWGDYRPVKKDEVEEDQIEFKDVMKVFNQKYGRGTVVHPGMVDPYEGKNVVQFEDLDAHLGLDTKPVVHYSHHHEHHEPLEDPHGWNWSLGHQKHHHARDHVN